MNLAIFAICLVAFCEAQKCKNPMFHYTLPEKREYLNMFALYNAEKTTLDIFHATKKFNTKTEVATHHITSSNFESFTDSGNVAIPGITEDSKTLYVVNDPAKGWVYATYSYITLQYSVYGKDFASVCKPCGGYDKETSPAYWVSPVLDKSTNQWVTISSDSLLTSTDLSSWTQGPPLPDSNSDANLRYIEEIFNIASVDVKDVVYWVAVVRDYYAFESSYFFFNLNGAATATTTTEPAKLTFDYGPDLHGVAVLQGEKYAATEVLVMGSVHNSYFVLTDESECWELAISFPRSISLHKANGNLALNIKPYGLFQGKLGKSTKTFAKTKFDAGKNLFEGLTSKSMKLSALLSVETAGKYGFKVLSDGANQYTKITHSVNDKNVCLDRSSSKVPDAKPNNLDYYKKLYCAPITPNCFGEFYFVVFVDDPMIEMFDNYGSYTLTAISFSDDGSNKFSTFADGEIGVNSVNVTLYDS